MHRRAALSHALDVSIFTDADDLSDLHQKVRDAVNCPFDSADKPKVIHLHFVREEVIAESPSIFR
jgi:hypothetical protein